MNRSTLTIALCGALAMAACKSEADPLRTFGTGIEWQVFEISGAPVSDGVKVTLAQSEAGRISGTTGCNRYTGPISASEGKIAIGAIAVTRMMCPEPQMQAEAAFLSAVTKVTAASETDGTLTLSDATGTPVLRARK